MSPMRHFQLVCTSIVLFFSTACAVNVKMPVNRLISPEAQGELAKGQFDLRWVGVADVELANNKTSATPNIDPDVSEDGAIGVGAGIGILRNLDFYYHTGDDSPSHYGLKWQILGEPRMTAKEGNHSLAIAAAYANLSETETENETFGSDSGRAKIRAEGHEALLLYGYRPRNHLLFYAGPYYYFLETKARIFRTSGAVETNTANPKGEGTQTGLLLGFRYIAEKGYINLESGYSKTEFARISPTKMDANEFDDFFFGGSMGMTW